MPVTRVLFVFMCACVCMCMCLLFVFVCVCVCLVNLLVCVCVYLLVCVCQVAVKSCHVMSDPCVTCVFRPRLPASGYHGGKRGMHAWPTPPRLV